MIENLRIQNELAVSLQNFGIQESGRTQSGLLMDDLVLVVEDEPALQELLRESLKLAGFPAIFAGTLRQGFSMACNLSPRTILVDWNLGEESGLMLVRMLRAIPILRDAAIIMVTSRDSEKDKVLAFECGVDDYITKPYSPRELVARVKAMRRRVEINSGNSTINVGFLNIEPHAHRASFMGRQLPLRPKEFQLLLFLAKSRGRIYSHSQLLDQVWGGDADTGERTVDAYVQRLRSALELAGAGVMIETVRGLGYCIPKDEYA